MPRPRRSNPSASVYDTRPDLAWTAGAHALYVARLSGDLFESCLLSTYRDAVAALVRDGATSEQQREHRDAVLQLRAELRVLRAWSILGRDVDLSEVARHIAATAEWSPADALALATEVALHERAAAAAREADPARFRRIEYARRRVAQPKSTCERCTRTTRTPKTRGTPGRERVLCGRCAGRHDRELQWHEAMRLAHRSLFPEV
jgi:hypothetical protein